MHLHLNIAHCIEYERMLLFRDLKYYFSCLKRLHFGKFKSRILLSMIEIALSTITYLSGGSVVVTGFLPSIFHSRRLKSKCYIRNSKKRRKSFSEAQDLDSFTHVLKTIKTSRFSTFVIRFTIFTVLHTHSILLPNR